MAVGKLTSFLVGLLVGVTISVTLLIIGSPHLLSTIAHYNNSFREPHSQPTVNNNNNNNNKQHATQPRTLARDSFLEDRSLKNIKITDSPQNKYQGDAPIQVSDIPNFVSQELSLRRTVFVGVLTSWSVPSSTQQLSVMKTWGAEMAEGDMTFYAGMEESIEEDESVPVQRVTGNTMGQKMYSALRHMCFVHLDKFKFFLLTMDNTYVNVHNLTVLLDGLQSSEVIYMGSSKRGPGDPTPVQDCELGPGVVLSRKAMQGLCTHVTSCAKLSANPSPAYSLALCLQMTTATNCTTSAESKRLFHKLGDSEDFDGDLDGKQFVASSVTLHPVGRLETMFRLHQSYVIRRIQDKLLNHKDLEDRIYRLNRLIATTGPHGDVKLLLGDQEKSKSPDVVPWQLIYEDSEEEEHLADILPSLGDVVQLSVEALRAEAMIETKLKAVFQRYHPVTGIEYRLEYEESDGDFAASHFVDVQRPYGNLRTVFATVGHKERVNFVVPVLENSQHLEEFLQMFESSCLTVSDGSEVALTIVNFGVTKKSNRLHQLLSPYEKKYADFTFKVIHVKSETFSYARGIELGVRAVSDPDSLLCFLDMHATISPDFMNKCRLNTQRAKQAYFPIPYQQFDLSAKSSSLSDVDISPGTGFWWENNFDTFCVYRSDVPSFEDLQPSGRNLSDKLTVQKSFSVFRVPEPGLILPQRDRHCSSKFMTFDQTDICLQKQKEILTMQRHFSNLTGR